MSFAHPEIGKRPIKDIPAPDVLKALREVEKHGRYETARRLRSTIGSVFRYAVATARADYDPTGALKGALTAPWSNRGRLSPIQRRSEPCFAPLAGSLARRSTSAPIR